MVLRSEKWVIQAKERQLAGNAHPSGVMGYVAGFITGGLVVFVVYRVITRWVIGG